MPLRVKINLALREQNCQKIGSERVKATFNKHKPKAPVNYYYALSVCHIFYFFETVK